MRVGLNTGEVVVRSIRKDDLHTDYVPVGHSTNLAARIQGPGLRWNVAELTLLLTLRCVFLEQSWQKYWESRTLLAA